MSVSQQKIADAAGVSRGTVDRVLHNRTGVSEEMRKKILRIAASLGYEKKTPSDITCRVAILIPRWSDPYFNQKVTAGLNKAERKLSDPSFSVTRHALENWTSQEMVRAIRDEVDSGVQGLILRPENVPEVRDAIAFATEHGVKVITYNTDIPHCGRMFYAGQNMYLVGRVAAGLLARLLSPSDRVLVVLGNFFMEIHRGRVNGFCARLNELGFPERNLRIIESGEMHALTEDLVREELRRDPKIRAVYMVTEPVSSCMSGIRKAKLSRRPYVVCNDLTPAARRYLKSGDIDFVIDQTLEQEAKKALLTMYAALRLGKEPKEDIYYTDYSIVTREMLAE